jgi:hypothetical protein
VTNSLATNIFTNNHRSHFGKVFPHDVKTTGANNFTRGIGNHQELWNTLIQLNQFEFEQLATIAFHWLAKPRDSTNVQRCGWTHVEVVVGHN